MDFKKLHSKDDPILICNVWDVVSAQIAKKLDFKAVATSSGAIASMLGYQDGEEMSFSELEYIVKRIAACSSLPLSVDLESGYSRTPVEIFTHIKRMAQLGVVGVNLEDTIVEEQRIFLNAEDFANTLSVVKESLERENIDVFLNVRTDTFLLQHSNALKETKRRIQLYENAGADGIFVPCIEKEEDIFKVVNCTQLPVNVMCMPNLSDFEKLKKLGIQRISMGNFLFNKMYQDLEHSLNNILNNNSFQTIFSK